MITLVGKYVVSESKSKIALKNVQREKICFTSFTADAFVNVWSNIVCRRFQIDKINWNFHPIFLIINKIIR
jgi:hypothetical protein